MKYIVWFDQISEKNRHLVGGKNASLGHMITDLADKVPIPYGFAITTEGYWHFLQYNQLVSPIKDRIATIDLDHLPTLKKGGQRIRDHITAGSYPDDLAQEIIDAYQTLSKKYGTHACEVAMRSSATAEDLPTASFAGQQETFLYQMGTDAVLDKARRCMASLFTDRAIAYRIQQGFDHMKVGLSVGVQKMVRSDGAAAGTAFSLDPETGFPNAITINGSWGLGEVVVKGSVIPDEFVVYKMHNAKKAETQKMLPIIKKKLGNKHIKMIYDAQKSEVITVTTPQSEQNRFCLSDDAIQTLADYVVVIEEYYSKKHGKWMPQDIEWAQDRDGTMYIVQARPETVHGAKQDQSVFYTYRLTTKERPRIITQGVSIGQQITSGNAQVIRSAEFIDTVQEGDIIVTEMTDPDWVPAMKKAAGIITDRGGRTCHAAIVSRELGVPAIIGTGNATEVLKKQKVTIDCSKGETGYVYEGALPFEKIAVPVEQPKALQAEIMLNIADADRAFAISKLPTSGVGLARLEFIIGSIGIHPMAALFPEQCSESERKSIEKLSEAYATPQNYFVQKLTEHISMIAAAFYPRPVTVRLSDLKSNEYSNLIGGKNFEPIEANPMIGWRGASRYYDPDFMPAFQLECKALSSVRNMGFDNLHIMVPFVRTPQEAQKVTELLKICSIERSGGLQLIMMCELPSNVVSLASFAPWFDGYSIGSNDLTQLVLGVDRDSEKLAHLFDERNPAVKELIVTTIRQAHEYNLSVGICGQAPSDYPEFAMELIGHGIDTVSLNSDAVIRFLNYVSSAS